MGEFVASCGVLRVSGAWGRAVGRREGMGAMRIAPCAHRVAADARAVHTLVGKAIHCEIRSCMNCPPS